jgi:hypothetical protein
MRHDQNHEPRFARILHDPPFHCGFRPDEHSYREYVNHINNCLDWECERRYTNHLLLKVEFARRYGVNEDKACNPSVSISSAD